jgi:DNA adenine methylase
MSKIQPLKWHGGKSYLAPWILSHFPNRNRYTHYNEPFAGGLSVLFAHNPEGKSEAVNDLNGDLFNFWDVLSHTPDRMLRQLWGTPLSQQVWIDSQAQMAADSDRVRRATAFFIRYRQSRQGLGKDYCTPTTRVRRGMNENVSAWLTAVDGLPEAHARLRRVEVRHMDAVAFIKKYDHPKALFYLDPPYLHETRVTTNDYECEMTEADHTRLLDCLTKVIGMFLLSGYPSELYSSYAKEHCWWVDYKDIPNSASAKEIKDIKTEALWGNYA